MTESSSGTDYDKPLPGFDVGIQNGLPRISINISINISPWTNEKYLISSQPRTKHRPHNPLINTLG